MENKTITAKFIDSEGYELEIPSFVIGVDGWVDENNFYILLMINQHKY